ncbi:MAG TPA: TonB-dependent receptor [Terriglobales bacterium]|nr:TonB-dependent receptor [Terriglobales bacterium]
MIRSIVFLLLTCSVFAQQQSPAQAPAPTPTEIVVVTGSFEPVPLSEANRVVVSFDTAEQPLLYNSFVDYLLTDPSIDLQQRGPDGTQADLSIRGATFEQSLVLLNGFRVNDAQTGHHDLDLPVPLEAISRIEVLHGAGSTLYGADAAGGTVNFLTVRPRHMELRLRAGAGNDGFNQQRIAAAYSGARVSEQLSASRDFSTGFAPDRDFRSSSLASETWIQTALGTTDVLVAGSDRPFGAAGFYGDFPSWERTKAWFASLRQELGRSTSAQFGYRRHSDEFILFRDDPSIYENNHVSQSWQGALRSSSRLPHDVSLAYGADTDNDLIDSNNLGYHVRNRGAVYANADLQQLRRIFLSLGAREEIFSGGNAQFAPTVAAGVWVREGLKVRGSVSRSFRLPTYTDLYYSDPANIGNPNLKPESAWEFEGGPEWNATGRLVAQMTVFHRREHNDIDYVRSAPTAPWQAENIANVQFTGIEGRTLFRLPHAQEAGLAYTWLHANQQVAEGLTSKYVFNYPSHAGTFTWQGVWKDWVSFRTRVGVTQRVNQGAYAVWDVAGSRPRGLVRPYVQLTNLGNTRYADIPGVVLPGRMVIGGLELVISRESLRRP